MRNKQIIIRLLISIFLLAPITLFSQAGHDTLNPKMTKEIYALIEHVIKSKKLDKSYGLELSTSLNCNHNYDDTAFLQTLLIKPKQVDTTNKTDSTEPIFAPTLPWPDKNIFTQADIDYILKTKQLFKNFTWDNNLLGFNLENSQNYYNFSVPYFNLNHDKAILMYEFLCPGLCGNGSAIILTKTEKGWDITEYVKWFH